MRIANPARSGQIAVQMDQRPKLTVARDIAPELASSTAPIAFPTGRLSHVAPDDHAALWPKSHRVRQSIG